MKRFYVYPGQPEVVTEVLVIPNHGEDHVFQDAEWLLVAHPDGSVSDVPSEWLFETLEAAARRGGTR